MRSSVAVKAQTPAEWKSLYYVEAPCTEGAQRTWTLRSRLRKVGVGRGLLQRPRRSSPISCPGVPAADPASRNARGNMDRRTGSLWGCWGPKRPESCSRSSGDSWVLMGLCWAQPLLSERQGCVGAAPCGYNTRPPAGAPQPARTWPVPRGTPEREASITLSKVLSSLGRSQGFKLVPGTTGRPGGHSSPWQTKASAQGPHPFLPSKLSGPSHPACHVTSS